MKNQKQRMIHGLLYRASDKELRADNRRRKAALKAFHAAESDEEGSLILGQLFKSTQGYFKIEPPFYCDYGSNITLGADFYANTDCIFLDVAPITIGDNVMFGPRVSLYTASHPIDSVIRSNGVEFAKPIVIEDNVWLGGNVVVNPGVTIHENVIIGSGSVVTKDIEANVIAAGNPCRVIRKITGEDTVYWQNQLDQYYQETGEKR